MTLNITLIIALFITTAIAGYNAGQLNNYRREYRHLHRDSTNLSSRLLRVQGKNDILVEDIKILMVENERLRKRLADAHTSLELVLNQD